MELTVEKKKAKFNKISLLAKKHKYLVITSLLGWVVFMIGSITDNIFAGLFLDEFALAAVEIVIPVYSFIGFIGSLVCDGAAIKYSHLVGEGKIDDAHKLFGLGLVFSLVVGILTALLMFFVRDPFLNIFNLSEQVLNYSKDYYNWFIGTAFIYPLYMYVYRMCTQDCEVIWTLASDISSVAVNLICSIVLVQFVGINGLGIGTLISQVVSLLVVSVHFFRKSNSIKFKFRFSLKDIGESFLIGIGLSCYSLFVTIVDFVMNFFITRVFGDIYLTSYAIINLCINLTACFTTATAAINGFISTADGSKNLDDVKESLTNGKRSLIIISLLFSVVICGLCWLLPNIYGIKDEQQFTYSTHIALSIGATFIFYAFNLLICSYYQCRKRPYIVMFVQLLQSLVLPLAFPIGLCYLFKAFNWDGYYGLIAGFVITPIVTIFVVVLFLKNINKSHTVIELPVYGNKSFTINCYLCDETIVMSREYIENYLTKLNIERKTILNTMMVVEDLLYIIYYKNHDKNTLVRVTLLVDDEKVKIIEKDDGKIFAKNEKIIDEENFIALSRTIQRGSYINGAVSSFNSVTLMVNRHKEA